MSNVICKFFDDFLNNNFSYVKTNDKINTKSTGRSPEKLPQVFCASTLLRLMHVAG